MDDAEAAKVLSWLAESLDLVSRYPERLPDLVSVLQGGYYRRVAEAARAAMKEEFRDYVDVVLSLLSAQGGGGGAAPRDEPVEPPREYSVPVLDPTVMSNMVGERAAWLASQPPEARARYVRGVLAWLASLRGKEGGLSRAIAYLSSPDGVVVLHYLVRDEFADVWSRILKGALTIIYTMFAALARAGGGGR